MRYLVIFLIFITVNSLYSLDNPNIQIIHNHSPWLAIHEPLTDLARGPRSVHHSDTELKYLSDQRKKAVDQTPSDKQLVLYYFNPDDIQAFWYFYVSKNAQELYNDPEIQKGIQEYKTNHH